MNAKGISAVCVYDWNVGWKLRRDVGGTNQQACNLEEIDGERKGNLPFSFFAGAQVFTIAFGWLSSVPLAFPADILPFGSPAWT